jgi:hypothetical protein
VGLARARYNVERLLAEHTDAKLTDLQVTLADCPKARSFSVHDGCRAVYQGSIGAYLTLGTSPSAGPTPGSTHLPTVRTGTVNERDGRETGPN